MFRALTTLTVAALCLAVGHDALAAKPKKKKPKPTPATVTSTPSTPSPAPATTTTTPAPTTGSPLPPPPPPDASAAGSTSAPASDTSASGSASAAASGSASTSGSTSGSSSEGMHEGAATDVAPTGISAALLVGYGFGSSPNYYGLALGARGGYTLPMHLYVGGTFVYHLGSTDTQFGLAIKHNLLYPGIEVGYDLGLGPLLVRPYAGIGVEIAFATTGNQSASANNVAFWPGVTVAYPIQRFFVGGDARFVVSNVKALSVALTGGMYF